MTKNEKIKEQFDRLADKRDYWKNKNRFYYSVLESFVSFLVPQNKRVLEVGCGTGDLLAKLRPSHGVGIDISSRMVEIARRKYPDGNLAFRVKNVSELSEKFDYIVVSDTIGYLDDVEDFFRQLRKLIEPNVRVVITQYSQLWEPVFNLASVVRMRMPSPDQNWLSKNDIENFLSIAGLEVIKKGSKILIPKYIPLLSKISNRYLVNLPIFKSLGTVNYFVARPVLFNKIPNPSVSIIVPARNEVGTIIDIVNELPQIGKNTEIIFIEGHSTDNTLDEIKKALAIKIQGKSIRYAVQDGKGKGDAVRKGFDMATGDILVIYDADMTVPPKEVEKFYRLIAEGCCDFANGSRLVYPMEKQSMRTLNYIGNKFFSIVFSWLLEQKIKDTLCGTKALWKRDYEEIKRNRKFFGNFDPFGDFDLLFGAAKINLKIIDVPVHYRDRKYGATNISRWKHGWLLLKMAFFAMKKIKFI
ncbi:MAG: type 12 methyltransferase [Parcubacteria group bacterium Licking1014_17]|nr:MAG: type 12 methyltransferase [Parcubacteria group bacterium Licking1014_17]